MKRNLLIGLGLALVLVGGLIYLLRDDSRVPGGRTTEEVAESTNDPGLSTGSAPTTTDTVIPQETDTPAELAVVDEPPQVTGRVTGEGAGIPGARVLFFEVARIEKLLEQLEGEIAEHAGGGIPDVPPIIDAIKRELTAFRSAAISTFTDEEGMYEVRGVREGGYLVLTIAEGWLFRYGDVVSVQSGRTAELDLPLEQGARIAGRVVRTTGGGMAGVKVIAEYRPPGMPGVGTIVRRMLKYVNGEFLKGPFESLTREDGTFEIASLPTGTYDLTAYVDSGLESTISAVDTGTVGALITFGDGARIEGVVAGVDGFPVSGVVLELEPLETLVQLPTIAAGFSGVAGLANRYLGDGPRSATSGDDGRFVFSSIGSGKYKVSIETPGFLPWAKEVEVRWGEAHSMGLVRVDRGYVVSGIVRDDTGRPLEGAAIIATPQNPGFLNMGGMIRDVMTGRIRTLSRSDGSFDLAGLGRGPFRVNVTYRGYAPGDEHNVKPGGELLEFDLKPGQRITGVVLVAGQDRPVAGARVSVGEASTRTDADGRFELTGVLEPGTGNVNPFGGGGPPGARRQRVGESSRMVRVRTRAKGLLQETLEVSFDNLPQELQIEMDVLPKITGVVLDPSGSPAPGALVRLTPAIPEDIGPFDFFDTSLIFFGVTVADLEGRFTFESYASGDGSRLQVMADHLSHARGRSESFELEDRFADGSDIEVRLIAACTVRGMVTDGTNPVPGASVRLSKARAEEGGQEMAMFKMLGFPKGGTVVHTNSEGRFELEKVLPGDYVLSVEMVGYTEPPEEALTLAPGDSRESNFRLDPGRRLSGEVTDDQGARVAGALVRLIQEDDVNEDVYEASVMLGGAYKSAITGEDGTYQIVGLPQGRYSVVAQKAGYSRTVVENVWPTQDSTQSLALVPAARLRGVVLDAATSAPVPSFRFSIQKKGDDSMEWNMGRREVNDADGVFKTEELEAGLYEVNLRSAGFVSTTVDVQLTPGHTADQIFTLPQAGRIRGRVIDQKGNPVERARVALVKPRDSEDAEKSDEEALREFFTETMLGEMVFTDSAGEFLLETVPEGVQVVVVSHDDFVQKKEAGLQVSLGQEIALEMTLSPGLSLSGQVIVQGGVPQPYRFLFLRGEDGESKSVQCDEDGKFSFGGLRKGKYRVLAPGRRGQSRDAMEFDVTEDVEGVTVMVEPTGS